MTVDRLLTYVVLPW